MSFDFELCRVAVREVFDSEWFLHVFVPIGASASERCVRTAATVIAVAENVVYLSDIRLQDKSEIVKYRKIVEFGTTKSTMGGKDK